MRKVLLCLVSLFLLIFTSSPVLAIYDPLSVPNNKVGINISFPTNYQYSLADAQPLINTNGDWGYISVILTDDDTDGGKWQSFFNFLRKRHIIPIVRLSTHIKGNWWVRPVDNQEKKWA